MSVPHEARVISAGPPAAVTRARIPIDATDRLLNHVYTLNITGPLRLPARGDLVDALFTIASLGPVARVGLLLEEDRRHWRFDSSRLRQLCETAVHEADATIGALAEEGDIGAILQAYISRAEPRRPVTIVIAGDYLLQIIDHSLGDAALMIGLPGALLDVASGGRIPEWLSAPSTRHPVRASVIETFLRKPSRISALFRERRVNAFQERASSNHATQPWVPRLHVLSAAMTPESSSHARAWLKASGTEASFGAASIVMLRRALVLEGIPVSDESELVHDVRRYLPASARVLGNFVVGVPATGGDDLAAVGASIRRTIEVGRPVASLAAAALRESLQPTSTSSPEIRIRPSVPLAHIVLSNIGIPEALKDLPWRSDHRTSQSGWAISEVRPDRLSFLVATVGGSVVMSLTFHANVFPPEAVERAFARLAEDPIALLEAPSSECLAASGSGTEGEPAR